MVELAGIIILGILAQWMAWRLKIPAILPLILIGLFVGPVSTLISEDGKNWRVIPADLVNETQLGFTLKMTGNKMYVASVEHYRISDLDNLLTEIRDHPRVAITPVGHTVEGRPWRKPAREPAYQRQYTIYGKPAPLRKSVIQTHVVPGRRFPR